MLKEYLKSISEVVKRANKNDLLMFDSISLFMDLECAVDVFDIDIEKLLTADDFNFAHDICGIQNNLNRYTKQFENCFVPRFARK